MHRFPNVPRYEFFSRMGHHGKPLDAYGEFASSNYFVKDGVWDECRDVLHKIVLEKLKNFYASVKKERKAVVIGGEPGVGKTAFVNGVHGLSGRYAISDPDFTRSLLIRELIHHRMEPTFQVSFDGGVLPFEISGLFHQEAQVITEQFEQWLLESGRNIIIDTSMANASRMERYATSLTNYGYESIGVLLVCDYDVARTRRVQRYRYEAQALPTLGGRPVPQEFCDYVRKNAPNVFHSLHQSSRVFNHSLIFDVNGKTPRIVFAWTEGNDVTDIATIENLDFSPERTRFIHVGSIQDREVGNTLQIPKWNFDPEQHVLLPTEDLATRGCRLRHNGFDEAIQRASLQLEEHYASFVHGF